MKISCSRCGAEHEFRYSAENVLNAVYNLGWGSCGDAFFCPECIKGRPRPERARTVDLIDETEERT